MVPMPQVHIIHSLCLCLVPGVGFGLSGPVHTLLFITSGMNCGKSELLGKHKKASRDNPVGFLTGRPLRFTNILASRIADMVVHTK